MCVHVSENKMKKNMNKKHKRKLQMKMTMELNDGKCVGWRMWWGDG
jgi:hypothetical protein